MCTSLQRMENYRGMIEPKIHQYRLPIGLLAVPILESGYQNLAQGTNQMWGAGIWMFIALIARNYGLHVDDKVDENSAQKAIDKTGSRDAWELIRQGYEGDQDYLARVMATVLILKNPHSVE
jgi:hypothetical protein